MSLTSRRQLNIHLLPLTFPIAFPAMTTISTLGTCQCPLPPNSAGDVRDEISPTIHTFQISSYRFLLPNHPSALSTYSFPDSALPTFRSPLLFLHSRFCNRLNAEVARWVTESCAREIFPRCGRSAPTRMAPHRSSIGVVTDVRWPLG